MCHAAVKKVEGTDKSVNTASSGFHIFEIHAPSAGLGIAIVMGILGAILLLWCICRLPRLLGRFSGIRRLALPIHQPDNQMLDFSPDNVQRQPARHQPGPVLAIEPSAPAITDRSARLSAILDTLDNRR